MKIRLLFTTMLLLIMSSATLRADNISVTGSVSGTWNSDTVHVQGFIYTPAGQTLTIEPGTRVIFADNYTFDIQGILLAQGSATDTIFFTVADTTGFASSTSKAGGWGGIRFATKGKTADTSRISYCHFSYGKAMSEEPQQQKGGAINLVNVSNITIDNSMFYHNSSQGHGGAIYMENSQGFIRNCTFTQNIAGTSSEKMGYGGGLCGLNASPLVYHCVFDHNISNGVGGGCAFFSNADPRVDGNIFFGNFGRHAGAIGLFSTPATNGYFANNVAYDNGATYFGGAFWCVGANGLFINNTAVNNSTIYGGAFFFSRDSKTKLYNNLFYDNKVASTYGEEVYIMDVLSAPDFYNNNIAGGTEEFAGSGAGEGFKGAWEDNIDVDPMFVTGTQTPWVPAWNSPCNNQGTTTVENFTFSAVDAAGNPRIKGSSIDMGAYECQSVDGLTRHKKSTQFTVYPNPCTEVVYICLAQPCTQLQLMLTDASGHLILSQQLRPTDDSTLTVSIPENLPRGIYFIRLQHDNIVESSAIIKK